ncbi:MAG: PilZ domain-containing protein [Terracidiphilus sp.]|jgi:c-di-GMP-binding flagellar brake protein YcgR
MESAEMAAELAASEQNRRAAPRQVVDEDARLLLVEHGSTFSCRIVDISMSGCRLRTKERFAGGSIVCVEVAFKVRGLAFRFSGTTQWTDGRHLVGIRFTGVSARRREDLVEALSEVEAENAAKAAKHAGDKPIALKGHDFSRAVNTTKQSRALALEGCFSLTSPEEPSLSAACLAPEPASSSQAKIVPRERRVQSREVVETTAVIHLINIASRLPGRILDLSLGGCRIRADERFPVGIYTRVETEFRIEGLPFRLGGVIQAIHDRRTVGIRFLDLSSRKREQVTQLIEEIRQMKEQGSGNRE